MRLRRRDLLVAGALLPAAGAPQAQKAPRGIGPRELVFPADFGSHPETRREWWYVTGWLAPASAAAPGPAAATHGFQVTFFRARTGVAENHPSAFAARQLVAADAALTDLRSHRLRQQHALARTGFGRADATTGDTGVHLDTWALRRSGTPTGSVYAARVNDTGAGFGLDFRLRATQPVLLQGERGLSRRGPRPEQASHYYSEPQLAVSGQLQVDGGARAVSGRAWLDHEWFDEPLDPQAVGWDWLGMNLFDGSTLMATRFRRADGTPLWAFGSFRSSDGTQHRFGPGDLVFTPGRTWVHPVSGTAYPVEWRVQTPAGTFTVHARVDAQEVDSRAAAGARYWEGLSDLRDESGRAVGLGYLELTGYAERLRL